MVEPLIIILYVLAVICLVFVFLIFKIYKHRKSQDKPLIPQYKRSFRTPTWRFQKYHPHACPHYNGIYRNIQIKVLDDIIQKTIFVCADCVDIIEIEEIKDRDKFKN